MTPQSEPREDKPWRVCLCERCSDFCEAEAGSEFCPACLLRQPFEPCHP